MDNHFESVSWRKFLVNGWSKFSLLMWKNWILQKRHPWKVAFELLLPILLALLLAGIRNTAEIENYPNATLYEPYTINAYPADLR